MITAFPLERNDYHDESSYGKLICSLCSLSADKAEYHIEPSIIIDNEEFAIFIRTQVIPDNDIKRIIELVQMLNMKQLAIYPSFYKDCLVNPEPIIANATPENLQNAFSTLYKRWSSEKSYVQRKIQHIADSDTYPALLIQSNRFVEQKTITRHPRSGKVLEIGDGAGIVHCSKVVQDIEANMIRAIDDQECSPKRIVYINDCNSITIRRLEDYSLTSEANSYYLLSKYENGTFSIEETLYRLSPDFISRNVNSFELSESIQYRGLQTTPRSIAEGTACFPWTPLSSLTGESIFLALEASPEDVDAIKKCRAAVFSRGGMTSHGAVICRALSIPCISGSRDLVIDWNNNRAYTIDMREIHEGDKICILSGRWTLGGNVMPTVQYSTSCTSGTLKKLKKLLLPYREEKNLMKLPLDLQFHISKLMKAMNGIGAFDEHFVN